MKSKQVRWEENLENQGFRYDTKNCLNQTQKLLKIQAKKALKRQNIQQKQLKQ